ncbi:putative trans-aconitate 3-methyltransferase [Coleophoma cylindrospora]|uniref:Putative trans-aconitate 3-methyltransferase n=1 Tax=Coleophoma cylindrospora TaxID=1849047 RepID=A0A3D8Q8K2_9HELO|nr:putative trans-aconitate 3-methyltransferase [Coleophoma cylindrospora]
MAAFAKANFPATNYATFRPVYSGAFYQKVFTYHRGPKALCLDLGTGHGVIARELSKDFTNVLAIDPSLSMIAEAKSSTPQPNITFRTGTAEELEFVQDGSLDMVVAGQAAHWFDYRKVWPMLERKVRKGGTIAFWGYKDNVFTHYPAATKILDHYCYGMEEHLMGPYWEQPGRQILRDRYRDIHPPKDMFEDVQRVEYEPNAPGTTSGAFGDRLMWTTLSLKQVMGYTRTFSAFHRWREAHAENVAREEGGEGDIVDEMVEEMLRVEPDWMTMGEEWPALEVENEWGSVILLARKR